MAMLGAFNGNCKTKGITKCREDHTVVGGYGGHRVVVREEEQNVWAFAHMVLEKERGLNG